MPRICCTLLALALAWGCVPNKKKQPAAPRTRAEASKIPSQPAPPKPAFKLDLPRLRAPAIAPAAKVVHLLYTSNADGELEPCG